MYAFPSAAITACTALAALVAAATIASAARVSPTTAAAAGSPVLGGGVGEDLGPAAQATSPFLLPTADPADPAGAAAAALAEFSGGAALLDLSPAAFKARGLEPEAVPHNITYEHRDRRELAGEGWREARATWYGGPGGAGPDGMSIYTGSCGFGKISNHFISAWQGAAQGHGSGGAPRRQPKYMACVRTLAATGRLTATRSTPHLNSSNLR
jgi:hypothetical protein